MKILLTGANGLLGKYLISTCPSTHQLISSNKKNNANTEILLDITLPNKVYTVINRIQPDIILHAASLGDVDYCEKNRQEAWKINVIGTKNLVYAAKKNDVKFCFFSTNAVFDGISAPYSETSLVSPINYYGKTKVAAEKVLSTYINNAIIFRLTTMYGWQNQNERDNPATWLLKRLSRHKSTPIVTDVFNNHLYAKQAAIAVWKAIERKLYGNIFHIAGKNCVSRYEFAVKLAGIFGYDPKLIRPVLSTYFHTLSPRAKNTCFSTKKMQSALNINPMSLHMGLKQMLNETR